MRGAAPKNSCVVARPFAAVDRDPGGADQQRIAHQQALALQTGYAAGGDVEALRETASAAVPIIRSHLSRSSDFRPRPRRGPACGSGGATKGARR